MLWQLMGLFPMLTIHEITGATDAKRYYAAADYYSQGQETVGLWGGKLAASLGLAGTVTKDAFDRMVDNLHPITGERLTQRTNDNRRVGYDFTVSLNKSASILRAFADDELGRSLDAARDDAIAGMMAEAEADMGCRERRNGADHDVATGNMAWAAFHHTTSRPVPGQVPDMNEHTYLVVFNATRRSDGEILAGQFGPLKRDGEYYSAVFDSLYARGLERLGFAIDRRGGKKWEIAGIPQTVTDKFSKRTEEIEAEAERLGIVDARRKAELGAKTRSRKQKELTPAELREAWDAQLTDDERDALAAVYRRETPGSSPVAARDAVAFAIDHCSEKLSVIPGRSLKRVALLHGLGHVTPEQIDREMRLPRHGLIVDEIDGRRMATTAELQREEDYIAGVAARGLGTLEPVGVADGLQRGRLNDGQWDAARGLLESENRVNLVEGPAGAGKSSMLGTFGEGMRLAGKSVTYLATTAKAAEVLEKDGFDAHTVARFLVDERMQKAARGGRIVIDESSMLGHKDTVRLMGLAEKLDLKPVFVADPMQHGSVPRGSFLHVLKEYGHIRPFKLTRIMRQDSPEYRAASGLLSEGRTLEGFDALDSLGWVKELGDDAERVGQVAAEYLEATRDGKSVLVVSPTHREAAAITDAIRSELRQAGKLGAEDQAFTRLVAVDSTEAERGQKTTYRPGDILVFHQNAKGGFKKGDRLTVADPAAVPLSEAGKFSLYRPAAIGLAEGDVIRFTGTVKMMDGKHTLKNGATRTVAEITPGGNIRLDNGWLVGKDAGHFRHSFVETSFGSQGRTVDRAILAMSAASLPATNQEQLYVSASRARERTTLYTDDKDAVRQAVQRSSRKLAALDLRPKPPKAKLEAWHRWQAERRRRLAYLDRIQAAWPIARGPQKPTPPRTPTHTDRVRARQEKEHGHER